jgi:hypothetical protein
MRVALCHWRRQWQVVRYETDSGSGHLCWFRRISGECAGWAYRHRRVWYAVWSDNGRLVFQVGRQSWPIGDGFVFTNQKVGAKVRRFAVSSDQGVIFELLYRQPRWWLSNRWDVTYDSVDEEMDDFFLWVSRLSEEQSIARDS